MKKWIAIAMSMTFALCGTAAASAYALKMPPAAGAQTANDNMTPYRKLAADALAAFKAQDMAGAKKKARELEVAWDDGEKALKKKSPDVWGQIDKAMDGFVKPLQGKGADPAKIQSAYDAFIAKLQLAVNTDTAPKAR